MKFKVPFKIGDKVSVINDTLEGEIVQIDKETVTICSADGFHYKFLYHELVARKEWKNLIETLEPESPVEPARKKPKSKSKKGELITEVDLHIHELIDSEKGMSNFEKLSLQLETARKTLESSLAKKHQKIIFIHGRGAGVLKKELINLLSKYPVIYHDASYSEYGQGATEVILFQNRNKN